jgi:hypothetical protein
MTIDFNYLINPTSNLVNPDEQERQQPAKVRHIAWLESLLSLTKSPKIHDYRQYESGIDYVFELVDNTDIGYMTGQGTGIKPGDYLLLLINHQVCKYQIKEIDYYSNPSDMWIASLKYII